MVSFGLFFNDLSLVSSMEAKVVSLMLPDNAYISHRMPRRFAQDKNPKDSAGGCGTRWALPTLAMAEKEPEAGPFPRALGSHVEFLAGSHDVSIHKLGEW